MKRAIVLIAAVILPSAVLADIIFVPDDYPTIQEAIAAAADGDEVVVSEGTYVETIDFLDKDITVRSTDPSDDGIVNNTIIDGNHMGTVVTLSAGTLDGLTICNGDGDSDSQFENAGGAYATGTATITRCVLMNNHADGDGGGIIAEGEVFVINNRISNNSADEGGGGATLRVFDDGALLFADNVVENNIASENSANGGGVSAAGNVTVSGCTIRNNIAGNQGGGVFNASVVEDCIISENDAFYAGGVQSYDNAIIRDNLISYNNAEVAAGVRVGQSGSSVSVLVVGNIISDNIADQHNGAIQSYGDSIVTSNVIARNVGNVGPFAVRVFDRTLFSNNTVMTNTAGVLATYGQATVVNNIVAFSLSDGGVTADANFSGVMDYNCVYGNIGGDYLGTAQPGQHDINEDPRLDFGDHHLQADSPCIDIGTGQIDFVVVSGPDVDDEDRVMSCGVDIGADEVPGETTYVLSVSSALPDGTISLFPADCEGNGHGSGAFNRFYTSSTLVTLTAEDQQGFLRWIVNGQPKPDGQRTIIVSLPGHTEVEALYNIITVPDQAQTIQEAINGAIDGTVILVSEGTYIESINFLGKDITVRSTDPLDPAVVAATIIDGGGTGDVVALTAGEIAGFTIRNGSTGVEVSGDGVVTRNIIRDNQNSSRGGGVYAHDAAKVLFNTITGNYSETRGGGVYASNSASSDVVMIGNFISYNTAEISGGGIYVPNGGIVVGNTIVANAALESGGGIAAATHFWTGTPVIANNIVAFSTFGGGIETGFGARSDYNCVFGNAGGEYLGFYGPRPHDINEDPLLTADGLHLSAGSPCISAAGSAYVFIDIFDVLHLYDRDFNTAQFNEDFDGESRLMDCGWDIGADEFSMAPSAALVVTAPGRAEVGVSEADCGGARDGQGSFNRFYDIGTSITLTAEPIQDVDFVKWVVDGVDQPLGQSLIPVQLYQEVRATAVYTPVSVPLDFATIDDAIRKAVDGIEIIIEPGEYEELAWSDKNILLRSTDPMDPQVVAQTIIKGQLIENQPVVQIIAGQISGFTVTNGDGGLSAGGTAIVSRNLITGNFSYAAAGIVANYNAIIAYNTVTGNVAEYKGGGLYLVGGVYATGNVVFLNEGPIGGGVFARSNPTSGNPVITNNLIHSNVGEGIEAENNVTITNNIVLANLNAVGIAVAGDDAFIDYNCIFANENGPHGGSAQPGEHDLLVDPRLQSDNVHLKDDSPCIDAGAPDFIPMEGETDIDGEPRVQGGRVDIGADETPAAAETVLADDFNIFRGTYVTGELSDSFDSDDSYLKFKPGITLNSSEPPVWIEFTGASPTDGPSSFGVILEASANTVGLAQTIDMFNWNTGKYEEVDSRIASFASDSVVTFDLIDSISDYIETGTGAIKSRVGWRRTGPIFLFPWTICIDQFVWTVTE